MATLYITEQNSVLRKTGDRLILQKNDEILLDVQCHKIDAVLIFGNVQFTTQAVNELFDHGIEMAILSRSGRLKGQIVSPKTKNINLRLAQFKKYDDIDFRLGLSKVILTGKIKNSLNFIRRFTYNHPEIDLNSEISGIESAEKLIHTITDINQLFGIEGTAAKHHFKAFGKMVLKNFSFSKRTKRPPEDPVNALLSLSYTMIFNEISSLLDGLGFDPYLGYFHHASYGRESLAADLIEEFRAPLADRLTLNLVNNQLLKEDDFYTPSNGGTYLKRDGLKRFFGEYEKFLNNEFKPPDSDKMITFRKSFRSQAENMAGCILDNAEYTPFAWRVN